jgi:hypothetical protein
MRGWPVRARPTTDRRMTVVLLCGICGAWAEVLPSVWLSERLRLQEHAWDAHQMSPALVQQARQDGTRWVLPDGRVWVREVPDDGDDSDV